MKSISSTGENVFLVFNTACLGDVLLCNSLVQNIKKAFPESRVVFICDKKFKEAALYQSGVDEVVIFDKKGEHKGLFGIFKFIKSFKYKHAFVSFITYHNERNYIISKLLGTKNIIMAKHVHNDEPVLQRHNSLLKKITDKNIINCPIRYNVPQTAIEAVSELLPNNKSYITLCATSKKDEKDIPLPVCAELIKKLAADGISVVFTGAGEKSLNYAEHLKENGCDFINLVNKTTIAELAAVIKSGRLLLSVDTGTLHLGTSLGGSVVAVWYETKTAKIWMPSSDLYDIKIIEQNQTAQNIYRTVIGALEDKNV